MVVRGALSVISGQVKRHLDLWPLFAAYGFATGLSASIMLYTSLNKADVVWNKWNPVNSYDRINWEKHEQKLAMGIPSEKQFYKKNNEILSLRDEIYRSGQYKV